jgi:hypothetical protein
MNMARLGQLLPDLRQESAAPVAGDQDHAVDAGPQLAQGIGFVLELHGLRRGQQRDLDPGARQFGQGQGRKAGIAKGGGDRIGTHVALERTVGFERADAAAQVAVPGQGDEGGAGRVQRGMVRLGLHRLAEFGRNGVARALQQRGPRIVGGRRLLMEGEGGVADHARLVAGGIPGIALRDTFDAQSAPPGDGEQAVDRQRTAGLLEVGQGLQGEDVLRGLAIDALRFAVGVEMREVGTDHDQGFRAAPEPVQTSATSAAVVLPTASGTSSKLPSTVCRKGSCTSSECSWAWAASLATTCGRSARESSAARSSGMLPSGVAKALHRRRRQAAHRNAVAGPEQHHASDAMPQAARAAHRRGRRCRRNRRSRRGGRSRP